jgi:hypothetical protein
MESEKIKDRKKLLELKIIQLLIEFEKETSVQVNEIQIKKIEIITWKKKILSLSCICEI